MTDESDPNLRLKDIRPLLSEKARAPVVIRGSKTSRYVAFRFQHSKRGVLR